MSSHLPVLATFATLGSCVTAGTQFPRPQAGDLDLGRTTASEAITRFGQPASHSQEVTGDVQLDRMEYHFVNASIMKGEAEYRSLTLEFRDGLLNGYLSLSTFADERTPLNVDAFSALLPEAAFEHEVIEAAGPPNGKVQCPSTMVPCDVRGAAFWIWAEPAPMPLESTDSPPMRAVLAAIDDLGVYLGCATVDTSTPGHDIPGAPCRFDQTATAAIAHDLCLPEREIETILQRADIRSGSGHDIPGPTGTHLCAVGNLDDCQAQCQAGHLYSCTRLGIMHLTGICLDGPAPNQAKRIFEDACDAGGITACLALGGLYHRGAGVPEDRARALELYRWSCEHGEPLACKNLGDYYRSGIVVAKNPRRAAELYHPACDEHEEPSACAHLAYLYLKGAGVERDVKRAAALSEMACGRDVAYACALLARLHHSGEGVAKDSRNAFFLYRRACLLGEERSCELLRKISAARARARKEP